MRLHIAALVLRLAYWIQDLSCHASKLSYAVICEAEKIAQHRCECCGNANFVYDDCACAHQLCKNCAQDDDRRTDPSPDDKWDICDCRDCKRAADQHHALVTPSGLDDLEDLPF